MAYEGREILNNKFLKSPFLKLSEIRMSAISASCFHLVFPALYLVLHNYLCIN